MKYIDILLFLLLAFTTAKAQNLNEKAYAVTDRNCYLAGERLHVSVNVTGEDGKPSQSKVAYVEISDVYNMCAQTMVALDKGKGWADIPLSHTLHSGCYQLCVYTRAMRNQGVDSFYRSVIGVINPLRVSAKDNVEFLPSDSLSKSGDVSEKVCGAGDSVNISMPEGLKFSMLSVSVYSGDVRMQEISSLPVLARRNIDRAEFVAELEGHVISVRNKEKNYEPNLIRLAMIGKSSYIFDGQKQMNDRYYFYTDELYGKLPTILNAYDNNGRPMDVEVESPYAAVLPLSLPKLTVYCSENELRIHSENAMYERAYTECQEMDTIRYSPLFMNTMPRRSYNLDEWTRLNTVREIITEFIQGITVKKQYGLHQIYTYNPDTHRHSELPSLVLLDGVPVYNVEEILNYDAYLLKYVHIYSDRFLFGNSYCTGVVSLVSRKGRLSNFKLDAASRMFTYAFPQNRPQFVCPLPSQRYGTKSWRPLVNDGQVTIVAPSVAGTYKVEMKGFTEDGEPFSLITDMLVK